MSIAERQSVGVAANHPKAEPATLDQQRETLERRLKEGYVKIEEAIIAGQDVASWERYWIELLHEYEAVCARLDDAA